MRRGENNYSSNDGRRRGTCGPVGVLLSLLVLAGCSGKYDSKPTELESMNILRDLESVKPTTGTGISKPDVYTTPPSIEEIVVAGQPEVKLYYFCQYHSADNLVTLLNTQFVQPMMDRKGAPLPVIPLTISTNPATEQVIVTCPAKVQAQQVLEFLQMVDVPPIQVRVDCLISEVYADHTLDWETRMEIQNLLGTNVNLSGKLPGAALRDLARSSFGMKTGYVSGGTWDPIGQKFIVEDPGHLVGVLMDMLQSRGYLKILMSPQLEIVNGQTASIRTEENVVLDNISTIDPITGDPFYYPERILIVDSLEVTPSVFADNSIGLKTAALISSKSTPEGVKQVSIATQRRVEVAENRIRLGESLVIGGITKVEQRSVTRGIPGLKDLPLVGFLFSSKDFEERGKEVLFILTPTISTGGVPNEQILAEIRRKQKPIKQEGVFEKVSDPFGGKAYTDLVEEEATRAEVGRIQAEMGRAEAERRVRSLEGKLAETSQAGQQYRDRTMTAAQKQQATTTVLQAETQKAATAVAEKDKVVAENQKKMEAAKATTAESKKTEAEIAEWMKSQGIKPKEKPAPPAPAPAAPAAPAGAPAPAAAPNAKPAAAPAAPAPAK
jgi:Flp pilus assembly secretin CpaC